MNGALLAAGGLAAAGIGVSRLLPLRPLPRPTGRHRVGTRTVVLDDDRHADGLPVQVWYPTASDGPAAPLLVDGTAFGRGLAASYGIPVALLGHLRWVRGSAVAGVAPLEVADDLPAVVLVHGWKGFRTAHADVAEQLASQGHVVVAADHVGGSLAAVRPDGSVQPFDGSLLPPEGTPDYWPSARRLVERYAADLHTVLDAFDGPRLPLAGSRTLLIGHSTGGAAALLAADAHERVDGWVGLDPWVRAIRMAGGSLPSSLGAARILRSEEWTGNANDEVLLPFAADLGQPIRTIAGTGHVDFTLLGRLSPLVRRVGLTRADPDVTRRATLSAAADLLAGLPHHGPSHPPRAGSTG